MPRSILGRIALLGPLLAAWPAGGIAQLRFERKGYPSGICPATLAVHDMNEDGTLDLLTANHHSYEITILLKTGPGAYEAAPSVPVEGHHVDSHSLALVIADFDEDGHADAATSSFGNN